MLDAIKKMAADFLGITLKEVRETREALHAEVATEDGRYAARTQLEHPEGSTTPLKITADSAQRAFAMVREELEAELPKVMKLFLAYEVAEQRRDEAAAARDRHWDVEMARRYTKAHPKVDEFFRRLFEHGVTPHNLAQHRGEDVAIISDLHRWKAEDPMYRRSDNPWRSVYALYADRMIAVPGGGRTVKRSVVGTPVRTRRYAADKWYMFNEIAAGLASTPSYTTAAVPTPPDAAQEEPAPVSVTCSDPATSEVAPVSVASGSGTDCEPVVPDTKRVDEIGDFLPISGVIPAEITAASEALLDPTVRAAEPITEAQARAMAEEIYKQMPRKIGIYWPPVGVDRDDYTLDRLIPALSRWIESGQAWDGAERFLAAARMGHGREFIEDKYRLGVSSFARRLMDGDEDALSDARKVGFPV